MCSHVNKQITPKTRKGNDSMKQTTKVLSISVNSEELQDIRKAYEQLVETADLHTMGSAIYLLNPNASPGITIEEIKEELEKCYKEIIESWGPANADGSLDIDIVDYPSVGSGSSMGFILKLKFNADKEYWIWTLNLEVSSNYVYPKED